MRKTITAIILLSLTTCALAENQCTGIIKASKIRACRPFNIKTTSGTCSTKLCLKDSRVFYIKACNLVYLCKQKTSNTWTCYF